MPITVTSSVSTSEGFSATNFYILVKDVHMEQTDGSSYRIRYSYTVHRSSADQGARRRGIQASRLPTSLSEARTAVFVNQNQNWIALGETAYTDHLDGEALTYTVS